MKLKPVFILIAISLVVSYLVVVYLTGDWKAYSWKKTEAQAWSFLGEIMLVVLFFIFWKKIRKP
ncbi:hypothetical protein GCM10028807_40090 [Spirosoma daeguense]